MTNEYYRAQLKILYSLAKKDLDIGLALHLLQEIRDSKEPENNPDS